MILIAGGTGRLGRLIVDRLLVCGLPVRVLTRDAARAQRLPQEVELAVGDVRDPVAVRLAVRGTDTVISVVHGFAGPGHVSPESVDRDGNRVLVDAAAEAGASVVLMSAVGASADNPMILLRMKHAAERYLRESPVPWAIVRASPFAELWIDLIDQSAAKGGRPLVFGRGQMPIEFVSVRDVAHAMEVVVADESLRGTAVEMGSDQRMTFTQLAEAVQAAASRPGAPRHVPRAALRAMSVLMAVPNPALARQARASLELDQVMQPAADASFRRDHREIPTTTIAEVLAARYATPTR